jgi:putative transposase
MPRVVAPGIPHRVTQRGNQRRQMFFGDSGYEVYRTLSAGGCRGARQAADAFAVSFE